MWALVSPDGVAPSRMVSVSASVIFPCTIKSRHSLLAPAHLGGPGKRAVKRLLCGGAVAAYIPSPIMYGNVIDSTCIYWSEQCGYHGNCLLYDLVYFRYKYVGTSNLRSAGFGASKEMLEFLPSTLVVQIEQLVCVSICLDCGQ